MSLETKKGLLIEYFGENLAHGQRHDFPSPIEINLKDMRSIGTRP